MKTQKNQVTLLIVFSIWLGLILGCSSFRKAMEQKRIEREGTGITISAKDLYKAYEANEAEADKLYQGKLVIVTGGKVGIINARIPTVFLMDARQKANIQCDFRSDQKDAVLWESAERLQSALREPTGFSGNEQRVRLWLVVLS